MTAKTKENTQQVILDFLQKFPDSPADALITATGLFKLNVYKALNKLTAEGKILMDTTDEPAIYRLAENKGEATEHSETVTQETEEKTTQKKGYESEGRDTSKYKFQGEEYGKGKLVLAIITEYVKTHKKITLPKLKEVFADESLQPRYGVIVELNKARKLEGRPRHFIAEDQILTLGGDKKKVVVCNQWGAGNIDPFIKVARSLGYTIKK
jgi:hypothetical protein